MPSQIAAQLYTLRDFTKTRKDIISTLTKVKKLGYDAVQLSALGKIDPRELANILKNEGLACSATHVSLERMRDETAAVIDEHHLWQCRYTAVGGFFPKNPAPKDWPDYANAFNAIAKKFQNSGVHIGYHNHSHEFTRYNGKIALQILLDHFSPDIWMELDTYWIQHGGADPADWINRVAGRIPCVHLKDMAITNDRNQLMAEIGEGNLNWPAILSACKKSRVEWFIIEQDICQRDPFESLGISLKNLKQMGIN
jgi:sugar phosphate isomerase/epimerase